MQHEIGWARTQLHFRMVKNIYGFKRAIENHSSEQVLHVVYHRRVNQLQLSMNVDETGTKANRKRITDGFFYTP